MAADVGLVAHRGRPAGLTTSGVEGTHAQLRLADLTIVDRQEGVHHWSQIQPITLSLGCRNRFVLSTRCLVRSDVGAGDSSVVLPAETTVRASLSRRTAGIRAYQIR